jgi:hypothetical protein
MNETILSEILRYLPEINAFYDCLEPSYKLVASRQFVFCYVFYIYTCFLAHSASSTCSIYISTDVPYIL